METTRRGFIAAASYARVMGANERVRIGVIGNGPRGTYLMGEAMRALDVEVGAVCDIYDARREKAKAMAGVQAQAFADYRAVLERSDLDGVIVATPDHWHAQITVDACKAGKDVYVEKPMVHYPKDGQAIVKAARAGKRVVQVGMQGRGMLQFRTAKEKYVEGKILGKVGLARTWYTSNQGYIQTPPPGMERKPEGLDWERWIGPGPKVAWNPDIYFSPYKWLHYDGGMIMGIGIHVIDTAHYILGLGKPRAVSAGGGIYYYNDGRDTPDTVALVLDYPENVTLTFVAEVLTAPGVKTSAGVELRGIGGKLYVERYVKNDALDYTPNAKHSQAPAEKSEGSAATAEPMLRDWVQCMKSRARCLANEETAYWSTMACFMGNRAYNTRSRVVWDEKWDLV